LKIVLRLGGSILGSPPEAAVVRSYSEVISRVVKQKNDVIVVVGGGGIARQYINTAKGAGLAAEAQDWIAIQVSRVNAKLFGMVLGVEEVATTARAAISNVKQHHVAVMGGLKPGITTDTVATLVAETWNADLIIKASDQKGIYTEDPRKSPKAKLLPTVSYEKLVEILGGEHSPGIHSIVDPVAVRRIAKDKIRLVVVKGDEPENVIRVVRGERVGTTVG